MKQYLGGMIGGNFYKYKVYLIVYHDGRSYYLAEPEGLGASRSADSLEQLQMLLNQDAFQINNILHPSRTR